MDKNHKNPEIRFKGFTEDWVESNFNYTFSSLSNNTLSRADLNYETGLAKNIHYGDILIKFKEILDIQSDEIPFISNNELVDKFKSSKLQNGDVIFADAAEDETVGKCVEIINVNNEIVYPGLHTIAVRPSFLFASKYLGYYLNSPAYHNQLLRLMQGTKVSSISKSAIKDTSIIHPKDTTEQKQIGTFFQNLDNLITLHQKKYDKLVILKKAMLVKMFPKNGALVPEIRFKGFSEDWIEKKLSELTSYQNGKGHESQQGKFGKYELINLNSISIDGGLKPSGKFINETVSTLNENDLVMILSDVGHGDLLGRVAVIPENNKFVLNQRVALLRPDNGINSVFLLYNINNNQSYFKKQGAGMSQLNLSKSSVEDFTSYIPTIDEQQKIGKYFQNLDNQIALHKTQLEKLNTIKKACFSKMFVAQD
jgi:type I restriction enzyme S subunit